MKKKVFSAFLLAGALVAAPATMASASENNTVKPSTTTTTTTASSNNTVSSQEGVKAGNNAGAVQPGVSYAISHATDGVAHLTEVTTLSNADMKQLLASKVTLVMEYTYNGVDYKITIPAGAAMNDDIRWYGPLYLAALYGNGGTGVAGATYTVKAGDSMSKIAQDNGMTLAELTAKNPQITDINFILVGQQINLK